MASPVAADEHSNTKTDEGTTAFHKKRSRRVSFAENTSIHFFDRDEEFETPPDAEPPSSPSDGLGFSERDSDSKQFFGNEDVDDEDDDMDEVGPRSPFLRLIGSPSSGGSTAGSATSNDDDNFFGPVSTSFIRQDLSDSAASDEDHDQTMDSTAFSMHYRSIARSISEGDLKTSTDVHLSFEEKTPTQGSSPSKTANSMLLTLAKKPNSQAFLSTSNHSAGSQSNDMSLVGEYRFKYDYGKLSPTLDALLVEDSKDLHVVSTSNVSILKSPIEAEKQLPATKDNGSDLMDFSDGQESKLEGINRNEMLSEVVYLKQNELAVANDETNDFPNKQVAFGVSSNTSDTWTCKPLSLDQSIRGTPTAETKELVKEAYESKASLNFCATSQDTPLNSKSIVYQVDDVTGKENKSPLVRSMTYSADKLRYLHLDGASPPGAVTPSRNQAIAFLRTENLKHGGSVSSLTKSISKLRMLEASPFSAALNAKLQDSRSKSLASLSKMSSLDTLSEKTSKAFQLNCMNDIGTETLDTYIDEQVPSATQKMTESVSTKRDDDRIEKPTNVAPVTCMETFVKVASPLAVPSKNTWSGERLQPNHLKSSDIRYSCKDDESKVGSSLYLNYSPQKKLKMAITEEFTGSPLRNGNKPTNHNGLVKFGPGNSAVSAEIITSTSLLTTASDKVDSLHIERREKSSTLNTAISTAEEMVDNRNDFLHDVRCKAETKASMATFLKDKKHESFQFNFAENDIPMEGVKASPVFHETADKQYCRKNLADQFCQNPSDKELYNMSHNDSIDILPKESIQSSSANQLSNGDVSSAERKRKTEDGMNEKIARIKRSPNSGKGYVSGLVLSSDSEMSTVGPNLKNSAEIHAKFVEEAKQLISNSADKSNLHAIDRLVDILWQLQRSKTYQLLSTEIKSQKFLDPDSNIQHKRAAETKLLLCKIMHEQAKLQLVLVKRERLLKHAQSLVSGIQESEVLKLNCSPWNIVDSQVINHLSSVNRESIHECQTDRDTTLVEQSLKDINRRISNLTKSFHKSCKMKGEPNSADTITFVNDHMLKTACSQIIRKDMQLWVIDDLQSGNGCHNVALNYLDLMTQRLTVTSGLVPSISISNELNDVNISKNFKDMDACTAFGFVFNTGVTKKHVGATGLAQETQMSSSLLGNLVDVMEEIQLARMELTNLISTRFRSPTDESLDLELCFFDPESRRKATVTLDASCLKRGIYPSEMAPCQMDEPLNSSSPSLSAAVKDLRAGYLRILRLCKCVSQLVSHSSR